MNSVSNQLAPFRSSSSFVRRCALASSSLALIASACASVGDRASSPSNDADLHSALDSQPTADAAGASQASASPTGVARSDSSVDSARDSSALIAQAASAPQSATSTRRGLPPAFISPPFPSTEYQGYPLIGLPPDDTVYPLNRWLYDDLPFGQSMETERIRLYGWLNASANLSTSKDSNMPDSYWIVPNKVELDQAIVRIERQVDSAQTDHIDWGFRSTFLWGMDYRYMTAGGWFSDQLLEDNRLYGFDPTEQYVDVYFPKVEEGMTLRIGRWIACPDIETQFAPDNYMGSHSLLFTVDTYTQTGVMATAMLNSQWTVQAGLHAGTDMAPWYDGAVPTGMAGVRWVALDNNDSVYLVLNAINDAKFQRFDVDGQPAGHDNFNYVVGTWQHRFNDDWHTKTESYFMWQRDAVVGGTPSLGPPGDFGGGGGIGATIPGFTYTYGLVNYTMWMLGSKDFLTFRNEAVRDEDGERYGFPGTYTSHSIGLTHNFSSLWQVRPEIGYFRNWSQDAFDLGTRDDMWMFGIDLTMRF